MQTNLNLPDITASDAFLGSFLKNTLSNGSDELSPVAQKFLDYLNASSLLKGCIALAASDNARLVIGPTQGGADASADASGPDGKPRISLSASFVTNAKASTTNLQDLVLVLAHELGHLYGGMGLGLEPPLPSVAPPSTSAHQYALDKIYYEEGTATAFSVQAALEIGRELSLSLTPLVRGLPAGAGSALSTAYPTQASLAQDAFLVSVREQVQSYHFARRAVSIGGEGGSDYYLDNVRLYVAYQMGLKGCPDLDKVSLSVGGADFSGTDWQATLKLSPNSPVSYSFDPALPGKVFRNSGGRVDGVKRLISTTTCPISAIGQAPDSLVGYYHFTDAGDLVYTDRRTNTTRAAGPADDFGLPAGTALAVEEPVSWLEYRVYEGDLPLSISLEAAGSVVFDEALSGKGFLTRKYSESVELRTSSGEAVTVHGAPIGSVVVDRRGVGALTVDVLTAGDTTEASGFAATTGGTLAGYADATNTLHGSSGVDKLVGGGLSDTLLGSLGDDTLDGRAGADTMEGGLDNDTYIVDNSGDKTVEADGEGYDTVEVEEGALLQGNYQLQRNIERGVLRASAGAASLTGNALVNWLVGNAYANTLVASGSGDTLEGKGGDDLYDLSAEALVVEADTGGNDTVLARFSGHELAENVENLVLAVDQTGGRVLGYGNNGNNVLQVADESQAASVELFGRGGNDVLNGGDGDDYLSGGDDDDVLHGGNGADELYGDAGNDTLLGNTGDDFLDGGAGSNHLEGGSGDDWLVTAAGGTNTMLGGEGNDVLSNYAANTLMRGDEGEDYLSDRGMDNTLLAGDGYDYLITRGQGATASGGADDDYLVNEGQGNVIRGDVGNDFLEDRSGGATFVWSRGDGEDYVGTAQGSSLFKFDQSHGNYGLSATKSGDDLIVSASSGGGVTFTGWFTGQNRASIAAPDGSVWTPAAIDANFSDAVYTVSYDSGVYNASQFYSVANSLFPTMNGVSGHPSEFLGWTWQSGLDNGTYVADPGTGHGYQKWGLSWTAGYAATPESGPGMDNYSFRGQFNYDVWEQGGSYKFAITSASWSTEHSNTQIGRNPDYPDLSDVEWKAYTTRLSWSSWAQGYSGREVDILAPAVTSVQLYNGSAGSHMLRGTDEMSSLFDNDAAALSSSGYPSEEAVDAWRRAAARGGENFDWSVASEQQSPGDSWAGLIADGDSGLVFLATTDTGNAGVYATSLDSGAQVRVSPLPVPVAPDVSAMPVPLPMGVLPLPAALGSQARVSNGYLGDQNFALMPLAA